VAPAMHPKSDPAHPLTVLILKSGRTIVGSIRTDQRGYHVETGRNSLYITYEYVKIAAADLKEAHRKLADSIQDASFQRDLLLGRWCFENGMLSEAAEHFRAVLKADPTNPEARQQLATLESSTATDKTAPPVFEVDTASRHRSTEPKASAPESLSQLSPRSVREYVAGIQPLLLSRCGNAQCHGDSSSTSFRLERVRIGSTNSRPATARNLAAILKQIDPDSASKSPLLKEGLQAHGGSPHTPLDGPASLARQERLRRWVIAVSSELRQLNRDEAARHVVDQAVAAKKPGAKRDPQVKPASATIGIPLAAEIKAAAKSGAAVDAIGAAIGAANKSAQSTDDRHSEGASLGPLTDPFDPAEFNQQHQR
jgi:hypothetical protein